MRAFLSHSSKDSAFVDAVASEIGDLHIELDRRTFEYTWNVAAIRSALGRSSLFVFFLSQNSIKSSFVAEEHRGAFEALGRGTLKRVLIFSIDGTSYTAMPEWMRDMNIVRKVASPKTCGAQIQAALLRLDAEKDANLGIYIGREVEEQALRKVLASPPKQTPIVIHAVGHHGIGRRAFVMNSMSRLFPRLYDVFVPITLSQFEGVEEFYRNLSAYFKVMSVAEIAEDFERFSKLDLRAQAAEVVTIIRQLAAAGAMIIVMDEGGVFTEAGDYQPFLEEIVRGIETETRPLVTFVQNRFMPVARRARFPRSYFQAVGPLKHETIVEIVSFSLKDRGINFTEAQLRQVADHIDGHPYNVRFAVMYIAQYGIDQLISDPKDLYDWKNRNAEDFLKRIEFKDVEADILSILNEYTYLASEQLVAVLDIKPSKLAEAIKALVDFCCIEQRDAYFHITLPIRGGVRRDARFERSAEWRKEKADRIIADLNGYTNEDKMPVSIVQASTLAAAKSGLTSTLLSVLILPSHHLRLARESYDDRRYATSREFCREAFSRVDRLHEEARVELFRIWGLCAIRLGDDKDFENVLVRLSEFTSPSSKRVGYFLRGFKARLRGNLDVAEDNLKRAWSLARSHQSTNRELATVYLKQRRYPEAEAHARRAYEFAPTNPFIIDIFVETLLGKQGAGLVVDRRELDQALEQLRVHGDAPGSSFYLVRQAQTKFRRGDTTGALRDASAAIDRTPNLVGPYFMRAEIRLGCGELRGATEDLDRINELLDAAGGYAEGDETKATYLRVRLLLEQKQFQQAYDEVRLSVHLNDGLRRELFLKIGSGVKAFPQEVGKELLDWARAGSVSPDLPRTGRPRRVRNRRS